MEAMDVKYKPTAYPNGGSVKKARQAPVVAAPVPPVVAGVRTYKECLKNHAAAIGAHAVDGCGEWMPLAELNPANVTSYKCAACGCHRNFHRQVMVEVEGSPPPLSLPPPPPQAALPPPQAAHPPPQAVLPPPPMVLHGMPQRAQEAPEDRLPAVDGDDDSDSDDSDGSDYDDDDRSISPPQLPLAHLPAPVAQHQPPPPAYIPSAPHMLLSLNSSAPGAAPQGHRLPAQLSPATAPPPHGMMPARKRFRTKFTAEQKQRMQELSERLGWRLQKRDEGVVDEWCRDIGVSKGVFKVWMHNNKHNYLGGHSARRSASATAAASSAATTPTGPAGGGPFRLSPATGAPPPAPFNSATSHSSPAPTATGGFNMNGTASSASTVTATPVFAATAGRTANGATSPQSA